MKLSYYPGCVARSTGKEYELSTRAVCAALGVELEEIDDWNCCGATHASSELLAVGLAARNMARAKGPVMASCSICYSNLRAAVIRLQDKAVLERVNAVLDVPFEGAEVRHVVEVMDEALASGSRMGERLEEGDEEGRPGGKRKKKVDERIVVPLKGLKVAPYYGCLLTRPGGGMDSPENPRVLERLIEALGATPVGHPYRTLCCGGPIFMPRETAASAPAFHVLRAAKLAGADALVTACPLCHLMLDARQKALEARYKEELGLPVLYVTQLAGIALGLGPEELGLEMNSVSPMGLLEAVYERLAGETTEEEACQAVPG